MGSTIVFQSSSEEQATTQERKARVVGKHVYGSAMRCSINKLVNEEYIREIVKEAVRIGNMTLVDIKSWKIGEGVSVLALILESHISVHTWPEFGFATIDVYSCGEHTNPEKAFNFIIDKLEAKEVIRGFIDRSFV